MYCYQFWVQSDTQKWSYKKINHIPHPPYDFWIPESILRPKNQWWPISKIAVPPKKKKINVAPLSKKKKHHFSKTRLATLYACIFVPMAPRRQMEVFGRCRSNVKIFFCQDFQNLDNLENLKTVYFIFKILKILKILKHLEKSWNSSISWKILKILKDPRFFKMKMLKILETFKILKILVQDPPKMVSSWKSWNLGPRFKDVPTWFSSWKSWILKNWRRPQESWILENLEILVQDSKMYRHGFILKILDLEKPTKTPRILKILKSWNLVQDSKIFKT